VSPRPLSILACLVLTLSATAQPAEINRVLRTFDFEERPLGNADDLPMHWNKVDGPGLPHYVNGRLATDRPRAGRYAFRFDLNGGSLVYRYDAGQIRVSDGAHYRVEGYVRTTRLPHARARISAYLVDADGRQIPATVRHSELYAARFDDDEVWQRLHVELSADAPKAGLQGLAPHSLVIELALLQPAAFAPSTLGKRAIFPQDIRGSAWFDDVTVSQVPRVRITTGRPGNLFRQGEPLRMTVLVSDRYTDDLAAQLFVHDAAGKKVYQRSGAFELAAAETLGPGRKRLAVVVPDLPAGWYSATMVMSSRGQYVGDQRLDFIVLPDVAPFPIQPANRFGVIATDLPFDGWGELPDILPVLGAGRVKLAVWSRSADVDTMDPAAFDNMLVRLQELRIIPTACLVDLPPPIADPLLARQRTADAVRAFKTAGETAKAIQADSAWPLILKAAPDDWQPRLAQLIARHASHLDHWQLGADGTDAFVTDPGMRRVYAAVHAEFSKLVHRPDLAMPWPAWYELDSAAPATIALSIPPSVLPNQVPLYVADLGSANAAANRQSTAAGRKPPSLSLTLLPLDRAQYGREVQIRDYAQRLTYALAADATRIDVPLPFTVTRDGDEVVRQPQEMFLIARTLLTTLGGAVFKGKVPIAENVEAFLFDRDGQGILVLWDRGLSAGGATRELPINLGDRPTRLDLWGNAAPLLATADARSAGTTRLTLGNLPVILVDIDGPLAQLRASVAIDRPLIESSFQAHSRKLRFVNPYKTAISGSVRLKGPAGWTVNPPTHAFSLNPGETFEQTLAIEFPYNSSGGPKTIDANFVLQADRQSTFTVPLTVTLGLSDVGMQTLALRDGADIVVQQVIQNYGDRPIDYSAFAILPGQARQERLVTNLAPGRSTIKRYRFPAAEIAPGVKLRVGVKELNGTRILNDEVEVQ